MTSYTRLASSQLEQDLMNLFFGPTTKTSSANFPKYNVYRNLDNSPYISHMEFALAGYSRSDLEIKVEKGYLIIEGKVDKNLDSSREYDYRGVARRDFTSSFKLGENVEIKNATFSEGLLTITLEKIVPEEQKPRLIPIG